ncbi:contractile injection system tape measure protein [Xenorhabdus mauleonii]|uniref:contractile injection system tape measure protein n=1 Tax=Xenorhabdus mauleonii TaxID=351675 RepID=UPI000B883610|nr:contractile injection system tape measure protein [Xenorhabdus mauleonii]
MERNHKENLKGVIDKLSISLETEKHHSNKIIEKCSALFKRKLRHLINEEVEKWARQNNDLSLTKIVLDLGEIALENFEQQFIWRLERELRNKTHEFTESMKQNADRNLFTSRKAKTIPYELRDVSRQQGSDNFTRDEFVPPKAKFQWETKTTHHFLRINSTDGIDSRATGVNDCNQQRGNLKDNGDKNDISSIIKRDLNVSNTLDPEKFTLNSVDNYLNHGNWDSPILWQQVSNSEFSYWLLEEINLQPQQWLPMLANHCLQPEKLSRLIKICQADVLHILFNLFSEAIKSPQLIDKPAIKDEGVTPEKLKLSAKYYLKHQANYANNTQKKFTLQTGTKPASKKGMMKNTNHSLKTENNAIHTPTETTLKTENKRMPEHDIKENNGHSLKPDNNDIHTRTETTLRTQNKRIPENDIVENSRHPLKPANSGIHAQTETTLRTQNRRMPENGISGNSSHAIKPDIDQNHTQTKTLMSTQNKWASENNIIENNINLSKPTSNETHAKIKTAPKIQHKQIPENGIAENYVNSLQPDNSESHTQTKKLSQTKIKKTSTVSIHQDENHQLKQAVHKIHIPIDTIPPVTPHSIKINQQPAPLQQRYGLIKGELKQNPTILQHKKSHKELPKSALSAHMSFKQPNNGIQTPSVQSVLPISNAGCMLLWPLLPTFFRTFDLLKEKQFISLEAQRVAVCLLDWMIWAEEEIPAWRLTLNKILCGLSIHDDALWRAPEPEQQIAINQWLEKTLVQLPNWKKMGINDVRHLFLQRSGELSELNGLTNIHIKSEVYDALINNWPWPINIARFSWLEQPVMTTWL